jgi:hypothetical protein
MRTARSASAPYQGIKKKMYAAIKTLSDTLLIRRLQARELEREGTAPERVAELNGDIESLEKGLAALRKEVAVPGKPDGALGERALPSDAAIIIPKSKI